ncbi:MAG TPA: hypothetical protein VHQ23_05625 [Ilumatobacteraceae bacterium]|nr:hypothetical protein [Ilumatobacteraceae bacterium]
MDIELRARRGVAWADSDDGARWAFRAIVACSVIVLYIVGRNQWFIRDDWAFIFSRERLHQAKGLDDMLFVAQDGHWMTIPIIAFRLIKAVFGTGSYWPYLISAMACHLGIAVMIRKISLRVGVTPWTATILAGMFAVFGSGWENIVFAIQLTYNLSLLAFLVQLWLIDHDGPPNHRDAIGAVAGLVAVSSSGFGPFFIVGVLVFMVFRRRWMAAAIATVPAAVVSAWWWLVWGRDPAGDSLNSPLTRVPAYVNRGLDAVFQSMTTTESLVGISLLATLTVVLWRRRDPRAHDLLLTLAVTAVLMYIGLGIQRGGFGVDFAATSRYVYMGAALLMPAFGVAVDQLARIATPALWAGRLVLIGATAMNLSALHSNGNDWANKAIAERNILELVAASPLTPAADPMIAPLFPESPDVRLIDLPELVADGAIHPRPASTPEEQALVATALAQPALP